MIAKSPRGIRNRNPGNLRRSADPWQGLADEQSDPHFFVFREAKWGIRAIARTLIAYRDRHGAGTLARIAARWAPAAENDTRAYTAALARALGVPQTERIDVHDYAVMRALVEAIVRHENGVQPYTAAEIDAGLVLAGIEPPARALGRTRTVKGAQVAATGGLLSLAAAAKDWLEPYIPLAQGLLQHAPWLVAPLIALGVGWIVWARIDDRRRGLR
ncbi:MAG: structural protein P5 [Pseudomonadota bacterium]